MANLRTASTEVSTATRLERAVFAVAFLLAACGRRAPSSINRDERHTQAADTAKAGPGAAPGAIGAGDMLGSGNLTHYVKPLYPESLRRRGVQGIVHLRVSVGEAGKPTNLIYISGPKELVPYAENAVRQWRYRPTALNGRPVTFVTDAEVQFTISQ
jgi:TonB family protein